MNEEAQDYAAPKEGFPTLTIIFGLAYAVAGAMFLWMVS